MIEIIWRRIKQRLHVEKDASAVEHLLWQCSLLLLLKEKINKLCRKKSLLNDWLSYWILLLANTLLCVIDGHQGQEVILWSDQASQNTGMQATEVVVTWWSYCSPPGCCFLFFAQTPPASQWAHLLHCGSVSVNGRMLVALLWDTLNCLTLMATTTVICLAFQTVGEPRGTWQWKSSWYSWTTLTHCLLLRDSERDFALAKHCLFFCLPSPLALTSRSPAPQTSLRTLVIALPSPHPWVSCAPQAGPRSKMLVLDLRSTRQWE